MGEPIEPDCDASHEAEGPRAEELELTETELAELGQEELAVYPIPRETRLAERRSLHSRESRRVPGGAG